MSWIASSVFVAALAGCGGSAESRLKSSDEAAQDAQKSAKEAEEAKQDSQDKSEKATKSVRKERERYREKLQDELKDVNAKLAPEANKPAPSPQEQARLTQRRDTLSRDLGLVSSGNDHDWPAQKKQIEADLDAK